MYKLVKLFISFTNADENIFVRPLIRVLKSHRSFRTWCSLYDLVPGIPFAEQIDNALINADVLIVCASQNAIHSQWIPIEIAKFLANHPKGKIVPLLFSSIDLNQIYPGLGGYEYIKFTDNWDEGLDRLITFLENISLCTKKWTGNERRLYNERRSNDICSRLHFGLEKIYVSNFGLESFHGATMDMQGLSQLSIVLSQEMKKFLFFSHDGQPCDVFSMLNESLFRAWIMADSAGKISVPEFISILAQTVTKQYTLKIKDRRRTDNDQCWHSLGAYC